jgi:hypothetical protein
MSQRQRDDMVLLAHIREQHRLSLQSYGRPRMTEELQERGLSVGHGRVGRLMRENDIKVSGPRNTRPPQIAITRSISYPTFWIRTSLRMARTRSGRVI